MGRKAEHKKTIVHRLMSWSFSRLNDYRGCPLRAKLKHIDKKKEPEGPALKRGSDIHKMAENYIVNPKFKITKELKLFAKEFKDLRTAIKAKKLITYVEEQWGFDKDWKPCDWFGGDITRTRMMLDLVYINKKEPTKLFIIDYKTGKIREESKEQLDLYALGAFMRFPDVQNVTAEFWYLDQDEIVEVEFKRKKDLKRLKDHWKKETKAFLNDRQFAPKPGNACRWCDFSKNKQGLCKF